MGKGARNRQRNRQKRSAEQARRAYLGVLYQVAVQVNELMDALTVFMWDSEAPSETIRGFLREGPGLGTAWDARPGTVTVVSDGVDPVRDRVGELVGRALTGMVAHVEQAVASGVLTVEQADNLMRSHPGLDDPWQTHHVQPGR